MQPGLYSLHPMARPAGVAKHPVCMHAHLPPFTPARIVDRLADGPRGQLVTFEVEPPWREAHTAAGQYCEIRLDGQTGFFAIANRPGAERVQFYVQDNGGSSTAMLGSAPGAVVELGAPSGVGYGLDRALAHGGPIVAAATGSGWYGLRSALWAVADAGRAAAVYVGFRDVFSVLDPVGQQRLRDRGFAVKLCLSRPPDGWTGRRGYVQAALLDEVERLDDAWLVACGQPEMQAELARLAEGRGLRADRFLTNY